MCTLSEFLWWSVGLVWPASESAAYQSQDLNPQPVTPCPMPAEYIFYFQGETDLHGQLSDPVLSILPCRSHKCGKSNVQARKQNKLIVPGCKNNQYCFWCKRNAFSKQRVWVKKQQKWQTFIDQKKERSAWSLSCWWFHIWFPWQWMKEYLNKDI